MFRLAYEENDVRNSLAHPDLSSEVALRDVVGSYRPVSSSLELCLGKSAVKLDIYRDMLGLHDALLKFAGDILFEEPGAGPYREQFGLLGDAECVYSIMIAEAFEPQYLFGVAKGDVVELATRTLRAGKLVVAKEYGDMPALSVDLKQNVVVEICSFLRKYWQNLVSEMPEVKEFEEYVEYMDSLSDIETF